MAEFIKNITLTNFRQHSHVTINLDKLNIIIGENGSGKTSILEAICYALYGTTSSGAYKKELLKYGTKTGEVTLELTDGTKIIRDFGSSAKMYNKEGKLLSDKVGEIESYFNISKEIFTNILYGSQNDIYGYFIKFNAKEKDFIDLLFNIDNLTDVIYNKLGEFKRAIDQEMTSLINMKNNQTIMKTYMTDSLARFNVTEIEQLKNMASEISQELTKLNDLKSKNDEIVKLNNDYTVACSTYTTNMNFFKDFEQKIIGLEDRVKVNQKNLQDFILQVQKTSNVEIDINNIQPFIDKLNEASSIDHYMKLVHQMVDFLITDIEVQSKTIEQCSNNLQFIKQNLNAIGAIDQYRSYYQKIINDLNNLINSVKMCIKEFEYNSSNIQKYKSLVESSECSVSEAKSKLSSITQMDEDYTKLSHIHLEKQKIYTMIETTYNNLISYQAQLQQLNIDESRYELLSKIKEKSLVVEKLFSRDGFVSYLRNNLLKDIAVAIGESLEQFGFMKLLPVSINGATGALTFNDRPFRSLSGGEKTITAILLRIMYARILAPQMKLNVLMLDEPTADLDSVRVSYLRDMLVRISNILNIQIICITHDESLIPSNANVVVLNQL